MNYGKAIRVARALAGLQQKELASRAGLDPSHISLIEQGKRNPSVEALEKLATALGIPPHLLTLLGSEQADIQGIGESEMRGIAETLAKLLLQSPS